MHFICFPKVLYIINTTGVLSCCSSCSRDRLYPNSVGMLKQLIATVAPVQNYAEQLSNSAVRELHATPGKQDNCGDDAITYSQSRLILFSLLELVRHKTRLCVFQGY